MLTRVTTPKVFYVRSIDDTSETIELRFPTSSAFDDMTYSQDDQRTIYRVLAYANTHKSIQVSDVVVGDRSASCVVHRPADQKLRARSEIFNRLNFDEYRRPR